MNIFLKKFALHQKPFYTYKNKSVEKQIALSIAGFHFVKYRKEDGYDK